MTIIGISGYATAGKDTVGQILVEDHGFTRVAFADKLKELALAMNPFLFGPDEDGMEIGMPLDCWLEDYDGDINAAKLGRNDVRQYLQDLGVNVRNVLGENTWVNAALAPYRDRGKLCTPTIPALWQKVVVTDVRFKNEADAIARLNGYVWRVTRPGVAPANAHISEHDLDGYEFDARVNNEGTIDDLHASVDSLVKSEMLV